MSVLCISTFGYQGWPLVLSSAMIAVLTSDSLAVRSVEGASDHMTLREVV